MLISGTPPTDISDRAARLMGRVRYEATDTTVDGATVQQAVISALTSGNIEILSAISGVQIKIWKLVSIVSAAVAVDFQNGTNGPSMFGKMAFAANQGFTYDGDPGFPITFSSGVSATINLSVSSGIAGRMWYTRV